MKLILGSSVFLMLFATSSFAAIEDHAVAKVQELANKRLALEALTEGDLIQFDKELENGDFDLLSSPSYQRLLAARSVAEDIEEEMMDYADQAGFLEAINIQPAQLRMSRTDLESLKTDLRIELVSIQESVQEKLLHFVAGRASNVTGSGFRNGVWALTYDDGPKPSTTASILNLLNKYGYSATFFVLAQNARNYPGSIRSIVANGMEVANHSFTHPNMSRMSQKSLSYQIFSSTDVIESISNRNIRYFRLPYGAGQNNGTIRSMLAQKGLTHVAWNVDSLDWRDKNPESIYNRVVRQMRKVGGGVILFHDIHNQSVRASEMLMRNMRAGKIPGRLMSVSEAL